MADDPLLAVAPFRRTMLVDAEGNPASAGGGTPNKLETTTRLPIWASGQHVVVGASTAKSSALTGATEVMVSLSTDAYIRIGPQGSVVATKGANSMFLKAGGPYTFQCSATDGVAAIQDTAAGVMSVVPVA